MRSEARVRSSELDEAMQTAPSPSSASASRTPSTPFSSRSNAAMMSWVSSSRKLAGSFAPS